MKIKPDTEGVFYPDNKIAIIELFKSYSKITHQTTSKLIIVPHAGYEFSGQLLFNAYNFLDKSTKDIMIIAPVIYNRVSGCLTSNAEAFETPIGDIVIKSADLEVDNAIFNCEPALSTQLPIIKYLFPKANVIPILYGCENYKLIANIIQENITTKSIVIVTNLSRFVPEREALRLDGQTARMIERKLTEDFDNELADGAVGVCAAIEYAKNNTNNFFRLELTDSSKINGDTSSVVGYGTWYMD